MIWMKWVEMALLEMLDCLEQVYAVVSQAELAWRTDYNVPC